MVRAPVRLCSPYHILASKLFLTTIFYLTSEGQKGKVIAHGGISTVRDGIRGR